MEFTSEEKKELLSDLLQYSREGRFMFDSETEKLEALSIHLSDNSDSVENSIIHKKNSYFLKDEKARRIVFYSYLSMVGSERLHSLNNVVSAKNMGLQLGLSSIAVAQLIHRVRIGDIKRNEIDKVSTLFDVYSN